MRLLGLRPDPDLLARVPSNAPPLTIERTVGVSRHEESALARDVGRDLIDGAGTMSLWLDERRVEYALNIQLSDDELIHPWLAPAAAALALQDGRLALHGGVLEVNGRSVALVGDRESGKSTLVAAAAMSGISVLTDDVVVVDDAHAVHAGPRCIDLREGSAAFFGARWTVLARGGTRQRMLLPQALPVVPLAAVVVLHWGEPITMTRLAAPARLQALLPHLASAQTAASFTRVLSLARVPVYALSRPREWRLLARTLADVLALASPQPSGEAQT